MRLKLVPEDTNIDFFRWRTITGGISVIGVIVSIVLFLTTGLNYGIDFRGGTMIMVDTPEQVEVARYRSVLGELQLGDVSVTEVSDPAAELTGAKERHAVMIRIEQKDGEEGSQNAVIDETKAALVAAIPDVQFLSTESVGAKVSGELIVSGILALVSAVSLILVYIWLRFEWQFSVGAVVALVHDLALTIGIFALLKIEFNLSIIAALLTIVGYSLNDTVVVFDRVRENLRRYKTTPLVEVLNASINQTLSRTVMTSGTTLIALFALYFLGGEVIRGFTFAMIWGIVVGTYSSIYVASAIVLRLGVTRDWDKQDPKAGTQFANVDA